MEPTSLTRKDISTVLIRFLGVYFAYLAIKQIASVPYLVYLLTTIDGEIELPQKISLYPAIQGTVYFIISAAISFYLLKKGKWLIEFISKDPE
ncbi:MAG: hypothetical protein HRT61_23875 [Ekhidna sp.]|nr:hypothetical protein [Ekhidna sp.]